MSSANGNNITESFNSIRDDDDLCVSCGKHGCASKSNLCKVCQKGMGIKKISARRLAQLGWTAEESFGAEKNPHHYVKGTGGTPYVGDCDACGSKGSLLEDTRTLHIITCDKCGAFEEELFDAESFEAEVRGHTLYPHNDCEVCGENFNKLIICDGCAYQVCDTDAKDNMVEFDGSKKGLRKKAHYCKECNSKNAESFESESSSKEMTLAYNTYKKNLNKYVGFGDTWDKIHDESLKLQKKGLIAFDAWQEACKKLNFYDDLTRNINMKHLRDYEKKYEPNSYYGPNHYGAESYGAEGGLRNEYKCASCENEYSSWMFPDGFAKHEPVSFCQICLDREAGEGVYGAEESSKGLPWMTFALIGLGAFVASRVKTVNFKASADCGCGCSGAGDCGDEKKADEGHYPNTYDPVQDFLPRYRYPEDSDWSNSYNPTDPYRPLDYQTVQTDTSVTADRM